MSAPARKPTVSLRGGRHSETDAGLAQLQLRFVDQFQWRYELSRPSAFPSHPARSRRSRASLQRYPTPSCGACPAQPKPLCAIYRLAPGRSGGTPTRRRTEMRQTGVSPREDEYARRA